MALRTNSRKARQNLMEYIKQDNDYLQERKEFDFETYGGYDLENDNDVCKMIFEIYQSEKYYGYDYIRSRRMSPYDVFKEWAQGLALGGLFCYYANRSAVDDLGHILEESKEERSKFTEEQAEELLTKMIYREIQDRAVRSFA